MAAVDAKLITLQRCTLPPAPSLARPATPKLHPSRPPPPPTQTFPSGRMLRRGGAAVLGRRGPGRAVEGRWVRGFAGFELMREGV